MQRIEISSDWTTSGDEGQLALDVSDAGDALVVVAPMAGVAPESIEVYLQNDLLTIRGHRPAPGAGEATLLHAECFWGRFSRTVVLPIEVKGELALAEYANGVLVLSIPKREILAKVPVQIVED